MTTSRVRLGSIVNCASYRHPAYLARLAADLDNISGGRPCLGSASVERSSTGQLGIPFNSIRERQEALVETIDIVRGLWGEEPLPTTANIGRPPWDAWRHRRSSTPDHHSSSLDQESRARCDRSPNTRTCNFGAGRNVGRCAATIKFGKTPNPETALRRTAATTTTS